MKDLHIHTKYSDGEYNEKEIIERIQDAGINEFAICDHDTIEGSEKVYNILKETNSSLIFHTGIELSCSINNLFNESVDIHLLVRDFDYNDPNIQNFIKEIARLRLEKVQRMVSLAEKIYNISIPKKEIEDTLKITNSFGKPHLYKILSKYITVEREKYYKDMNILKSSDLKLDAVKVLNIMKNSKGYVTLAHPIEIMKDYNLNYDDIDKIINHLSSYGLDAVETKHSKHTKENYNIFSSMAKKYNLLETNGSDYHGPTVKPDVKLGICEKII